MALCILLGNWERLRHGLTAAAKRDLAPFALHATGDAWIVSCHNLKLSQKSRIAGSAPVLACEPSVHQVISMDRLMLVRSRCWLQPHLLLLCTELLGTGQVPALLSNLQRRTSYLPPFPVAEMSCYSSQRAGLQP